MPSEWSRIDPAQDAVGRLILAAMGDEDLSDTLSMVSAELLEHAIKYGKSSRVRVAVHDETDRVVVSVTNAVEEGSRHLTSLRERLEWMRTFASPEEAYVAALGSVAETTPNAEQHGLGILRIAYEGRCVLE